MAERSMSGRRSKHGFRSPRSTVSSSQSEKELIQLNIIYKNREHNVKIPEQADRLEICNEIKKQTGVKGAFYLYNGPKGYLHSSSLTFENIRKECSGQLEIRGGDWINKGGDSMWYHYSQTLRPKVQEQYDKRQYAPYDCPP